MIKKSKTFQRRRLLIYVLFLALTACQSKQQTEELKQVDLHGIKLHYKIKGNGFPLVLIHGSACDLSYWEKQDSALSQNFQMITYSRRYNYPNQNTLEPNHSAIVEAQDLLGFMNELKIDQAYIMGHSYGAYTALLFSLEHPERVKKLILAEPPLLRWLPNIPNGEGRFENFMQNGWGPIGKAFLESGDQAGLEVTTKWFFHTPFDSIPEETKNEMTRNVKEWRALATSPDVFPMIDTAKVKNCTIPTLLISGARNAGKNNGLIDGEISRLLPNNKRVIISNAGHEMFLDNPKETNQAIITFLTQ